VVTAAEDPDGVPVPPALFAATVQVYVFAFVNDLTVSGELLLIADLLAPPLDEIHAAKYFLIVESP